MTTITAPVAAPPRRPRLDRGASARLARTEYERFSEVLSSLTPEQWSMPTCCPGWDVKAIAAHLLGMAAMAASMRENSRQGKAAKRRAQAEGIEFIDALTALQVSEFGNLSTGEIVTRYADRGPAAARARRRAPWFVRRMAPAELRYQAAPGLIEDWTLGYLFDTILTRDPWMHRTDIAAATGVPMTLSADHDGVIVDDVVHEWADRHGRPVSLHLTGPAGGSWEFGTGGPRIELDAIDFCRLVGGRDSATGPPHAADFATGLLSVQVPF